MKVPVEFDVPFFCEGHFLVFFGREGLKKYIFIFISGRLEFSWRWGFSKQIFSLVFYTPWTIRYDFNMYCKSY